jgi:hypothetical protein
MEIGEHGVAGSHLAAGARKRKSPPHDRSRFVAGAVWDGANKGEANIAETQGDLSKILPTAAKD